MKTVLHVDDDIYSTHLYVNALEMNGFKVTQATSVEAALEAVRNGHFDLIVLDLMMPPGNALDSISTHGGFRTGMRLIKPLSELSPKAKLVVLSNTFDAEAEKLVKTLGGEFFQKHDSTPFEFAQAMQLLLNGEKRKLKAFIIHGHDRVLLLELKNYLQNRLGFDEPVILNEQASGTLTIIEKFQEHAQQVDCAFALLSPDDFQDHDNARARQNVIFELGYFIGTFGRRSGRVFLLRKGKVEIPSDLHGVVYIDVSDGIEAAGEAIRREVESLQG